MTGTEGASVSLSLAKVLQPPWRRVSAKVYKVTGTSKRLRGRARKHLQHLAAPGIEPAMMGSPGLAEGLWADG